MSLRLTVVGSGTVAPDGKRVQSGYWLETGDARVLLDCGGGVLHHLARFAPEWPAVTHILLTHFHADHVGGLPALFFALRYGLPEPRTEPLSVLGPPGTAGLFRALGQALGAFLVDPGFPVEIVEMAPGQPHPLGGARVEVCRTPHTDHSLAYRIDAADHAVGYTGDTGPSEAVGRFLGAVDVLLMECSLPDGMIVDGHLTPQTAAHMARHAAPRLLLLTHVYPQLAAQDLPGLVRAAGWEGDVRVATDGMIIEL